MAFSCQQALTLCPCVPLSVCANHHCMLLSYEAHLCKATVCLATKRADHKLPCIETDIRTELVCHRQSCLQQAGQICEHYLFPVSRSSNVDPCAVPVPLLPQHVSHLMHLHCCMLLLLCLAKIDGLVAYARQCLSRQSSLAFKTELLVLHVQA